MKAGLTQSGERVSVEEALLGIDWSTTALGHPTAWPQSLRSILALTLASGKPMFIVWGPQRSLLYNDAYVPLLGRKHPDALGAPFFSVWPQSEGEVAPLFDRLYGGTAIDLDDISISFDRAEGSPDAHFALSYTPIREHGNQVVGLLCIHSDTTDAALGPALQRQDHIRLAQLFDQAPSFIAVLGGPEHRVELANAGLFKLLGDRPIVGKSFKDALPDAAARGVAALLDRAYSSGERVVRSAERFEAQDATGTASKVRFIDLALQPITDGIGRVTGIFVHGTDVTERVRDTMLLRDRETHLNEANADLGRLVTERSAQLLAKELLIQTVYEHSSEYHLVVSQTHDQAFCVEEMNPAALKLYGVTREQVIGRSLDECLNPLESAVASAHLEACVKANALHAYEFTYGGHIIEGIASPLPPLREGSRQIAVSARDVTLRRSLEEQLRQSQKMEAVGQLTGGLAHDFNNLLSGISGALELLKARMAQGRLQEIDRYIAAAQDGVQRAAALTQRLLAFARRQPLDARPTDINALVSGMDELVRRTVGPSIEVTILAAGDLWNALVDPNQLENAFLNLCINARDAMPGGGTLCIETRNHRADPRVAAVRAATERVAGEQDLAGADYLSLGVSDTGSGMSPEVAARAFEPFFTTKRSGEGTGLGLAMVYGFARQSGGRVRIDSVEGRGTLVSIDLPRHTGAVATDAVTSPPDTRVAGGRGETVLVVDDEPTVRLLVAGALRDLGYVTIEAANAAEGLDLLRSAPRVDLLIADIGLPGGMDGRAFAAAARAVAPGLGTLLISGYADSDAEVLKKPFAVQDLALRVGAMMRR